jgi:hypothetical protein
MGIILEGSGDEYREIMRKLDLALDLASKGLDKRYVATLFWELSALDSPDAIKKRIKKIGEKRKTVAQEPGMQESSPAVDAPRLGTALEKILEDVKKNYGAIVKGQKLRLESRDWDTESEDSSRDFQYLRHVLRKYAENITRS